MGEIKSTLDLVMERTKKFSMSEEEKKELEEKEARKKISGLVQKYTDGLIKEDEFKTVLNRLSGDQTFDYTTLALTHIFSLISPGADNTRLLELIGHVFQKDITPVKEILDGYETQMASVTEKKGEDILRHLKEKHAVSGTAVLPNLMADDDIKKEISEIHKGTLAALSDIVKKAS